MKIISLGDILVDKSPHYSVPRLEMWDRHVPENDVDRRFIFYTLAHLFWERAKYQSHKSIPVRIQDAADGCVGEISLGDPKKKSRDGIRYTDPAKANWDENGSLKCQVKVYRLSPQAIIQNEQNIPDYDDPFPDVPTVPADAEIFSIYYSVVSQIAENSERFLHVMAEFPSNPFKQSDWRGISNSGEAIFPILAVPIGHAYYSRFPSHPVSQSRPTRQTYSAQSGGGLSEHEIWMSSMDDEEWSDTTYNLGGDD